MSGAKEPSSGCGHVRLSVAFPFGPTPPAGEEDVYDEFDCLQRTGKWCDGGIIPPGRTEP